MALALFVVSVAVVLYALVVYGLIVAAMGFLRRGSALRDETYLPSVTLIISAYNEQDVIRQKIENSLALDYPVDRFEIIVASESTDRTNSIVSEHANRIVLRSFQGRSGKSATLFRIVPSVSGEIVVFSDANAMYVPDAIRKLVRHFADPSVGSVVGRLRYRDPSESVGGRGETIYWRYEGWQRRLATRATGLVPGVNGGIFAIRKQLYLPISQDRGDDLELCTRIAIRGYEVLFDPEAVAEEQASQTTPQQFHRKARLVRWNTMSALLLIREALTFRRFGIAIQLVSQRLLKYSIPVWLLLALGSSWWLATDSMFFRVLLVCQLVFYGLGLVGLAAETARVRVPRLWLFPSYFIMVNSAMMVGLLAVSRGQVAIWQKQR